MKKILLTSVITCNFALAGGQEGTGSKPDETIIGVTSLDSGQYQFLCFAPSLLENAENTQCIIVEKNDEDIE